MSKGMAQFIPHQSSCFKNYVAILAQVLNKTALFFPLPIAERPHKSLCQLFVTFCLVSLQSALSPAQLLLPPPPRSSTLTILKLNLFFHLENPPQETFPNTQKIMLFLFSPLQHGYEDITPLGLSVI